MKLLRVSHFDFEINCPELIGILFRGIRSGLGKVMSLMMPDNKQDIEKVKEDIWADLSALYYKYDCDSQKKAFREVIKTVSEKISSGNWSSVYQKMNRVYI